jgi:hypothetical protein
MILVPDLPFSLSLFLRPDRAEICGRAVQPPKDSKPLSHVLRRPRVSPHTKLRCTLYMLKERWDLEENVFGKHQEEYVLKLVRCIFVTS